MVLAVFAIGLVAAYFNVPPLHAALTRLGEWKVAGGYAFSIVSTGLFGGTLPWLIGRLRSAPAQGHAPLSHMLFLTAFWGYKGIEIDTTYRVQSMLWGDSTSPGMVALKVFLDLGVWCAIWAVPTTVLGYAFKDSGFSFAGLRRWMSPGWFRQKIIPLIVSNFFIWAPAVAAIYCLPQPLQLPLQNLVLCFWSLILMIQVVGAEETS